MEIGKVVFEEQKLQVNGAQLHVLTAGQRDAPPVLCLHGFPDTPHGFVHQYPVLLQQGFRVIAPFLRGYPPSQTGKQLDCSPMRLGEDVIALIDHICAEGSQNKAKIVAHDWGGISALLAAAMQPEKIERMLVAAAPPFKAAMNLGFDMKQMVRSRYALLFQLGPLGNWWMKRGDVKGVDWLWSYWCPNWNYTEQDIRPLKDCLSQPGAMDAATRYYRQLGRAFAFDKDFKQLVEKQIAVNTLMCLGKHDGALGLNLFEDLDQVFSGHWRQELLDAGHFMQREKPEQFNQLMLEFLTAD